MKSLSNYSNNIEFKRGRKLGSKNKIRQELAAIGKKAKQYYPYAVAGRKLITSTRREIQGWKRLLGV
jgi:hypothetical protein